MSALRTATVADADGALECSVSQVGLVCTSQAKGSGMKANNTGVTVYGCLQPTGSSESARVEYRC